MRHWWCSRRFVPLIDRVIGWLDLLVTFEPKHSAFLRMILKIRPSGPVNLAVRKFTNRFSDILRSRRCFTCPIFAPVALNGNGVRPTIDEAGTLVVDHSLDGYSDVAQPFLQRFRLARCVWCAHWNCSAFDRVAFEP